MGEIVVAHNNTITYNHKMKSITTTYKRLREWIFSKNSWKKFYKFVSLPELKFVKTAGLVASWLL